MEGSKDLVTKFHEERMAKYCEAFTKREIIGETRMMRKQKLFMINKLK